MTETEIETGTGTGKGTGTGTEIVIGTVNASLTKLPVALRDEGGALHHHQLCPSKGAADALRNGKNSHHWGMLHSVFPAQ